MVAADTTIVEVSVADREAEFVDLFREYKLKAYHYALQTLGNSEDAMDVTQEAFLRLHRHWHRRDRDRPVAPWLYAIVRNLAIDLIRKRTVRKECDMEAAAPEPSPLPTPETQTRRGEMSARLWREIDRLPDVQKEALLLRDWHGLSYAEIADATGTNVTTINSRIHDARIRLRERLRRYM
jgi:RNA polymerase sigma-70 factor (ECF subfamily)